MMGRSIGHYGHSADGIIYWWYYLATFAPRSKYSSLYLQKILYTVLSVNKMLSINIHEGSKQGFKVFITFFTASEEILPTFL